MKPTLKIAGSDEAFEKEVAQAMSDLKIDSPKPTDIPTDKNNLKDNNQNEPHRTLVGKSRESFSKNLAQLRSRLQAVNDEIDQSLKTRHEAILAADRRHNEFMRDIEKDLYQIKTLMAAVELAIAALELPDGQSQP